MDFVGDNKSYFGPWCWVHVQFISGVHCPSFDWMCSSRGVGIFYVGRVMSNNWSRQHYQPVFIPSPHLGCRTESRDVPAGGCHVTLARITWPATDVTPSLITTPRFTCSSRLSLSPGSVKLWKQSGGTRKESLQLSQLTAELGSDSLGGSDQVWFLWIRPVLHTSAGGLLRLGSEKKRKKIYYGWYQTSKHLA